MDIQIEKYGLLFDFYGSLLSSRQREVLSLYYEENLSLGEIGEEFSISRQGVHDALKHGNNALLDYEEKLGLMAQHLKRAELIGRLKALEAQIYEELGKEGIDLPSPIEDKLAQVFAVIGDLELD